uniref:Suppressor of white apricot N-terminal domain-containing protein n=1 Tax=Biomphalaria glabrata TaxID=6526 RepID=A0A2C9LRY5_BIOGL
MMPWQGDTENMIDRFDVRANLDLIPEYNVLKNHRPEVEDDDEERQANYERYRTLVENEAAGCRFSSSCYFTNCKVNTKL